MPRPRLHLPGILLVLVTGAGPVLPGPVSGVPAQEAGPRACAAGRNAAVPPLVRNRMEAMEAVGRLSAAGERIRARTALPNFYLRRGWAPAWVDGEGPSACARDVVERIRGAAVDGLDPVDYHLRPLEELLAGVRGGSMDPSELVDLELLLTDAWLTLGSHLLQGRVDPVLLEAEWLANRRSLDMATALEDALGQGDPAAFLETLVPSQPGYRRLREELARLREIAGAGGWGTVPGGPTLRPGDEDPRVPALRGRLVAGGELAPFRDPDARRFDPALAAGVARFQARHGLEVDSAVGARTLEALNVPVEARLRQLAVNLERWRWLPQELGTTHIRVNIADYRVEVREEGGVALEMRAVVGRTYRQTPVFSGLMTYLVLAPYWHVPPGIAANDKLPELRRNPGYVAAQQMTLLDLATNRAVDPASVDFASMSGAEFNRLYRLRQDPGPLNALGRVKFMFPNRHNVYLHDTPSRELFDRNERAFSSGCIRLERPMELAEYLLAGDPSWPSSRIRNVASGTQETTVRLREPVPVHVLYWTAFADEAGQVHYRPDVYERDIPVRRALEEDPPSL